MNFGKVLFFVFACFMALSTVNAAPGNFFKDLEDMGRRVRDAVISAAPAVDVVAKTAAIAKG